MTKATFSLRDGTLVTVEGSSADVKEILDHYGGSTNPARREAEIKAGPRIPGANLSEQLGTDAVPDLTQLIRIIKESPESDKIEVQILDKTDLVNRVLLPLYVLHQNMNDNFSLTSGEISKVTSDLGVPISQPNVSRTLSGKAKRYVIGDRIRKKGQPVRYRISRTGIKYLSDVLNQGPR